MKKGFFLTLEDISGSMEFFMMDPLDLQAGDLITVIGWKSKNPRIQQIYMHSRLDLIKKLQDNGSYQAIDPIAIIRKQRSQDRLLVSHATKSYTIMDGIETSISKTQEKEVAVAEIVFDNEELIATEDREIIKKTYTIPEEISIITSMISIIKKHPGMETIEIGNKEYSVSTI
jgi:hypothetical protein